MSEPAFTPGPWLAKANTVPTADLPLSYWRVDGGIGYFDFDNPDGDGFSVSGYMKAPNAHLIAAAPDLYQALVGFLNFPTGNRDAEDKAINAAQDALRKARGES